MKTLADYGELAADIREILISEEQIQTRVKELSAQISTDYAGKNPILIGVLKGVLFFMADLLRDVTLSAEVDFLAVSSYSAEARNKGVVRLIKDLEIPIYGRHVLFVEDVIDTGLTLNYLLRNLRERQPASLEVCVLFNKPAHRFISIPLKYKGFDLPDRFVVGYGLDHQERYRNLPFIGLLKAEAINRNSHEA
ncbi:MAG TPA: hypoxanthine phosphoribosyltransferase [Bellilinea sp.]|jgi:hypoxanthine phosphoribosyltransferase|nr:hypoxanthine phosphoribosyltransferase [Bellilinea sp.]